MDAVALHEQRPHHRRGPPCSAPVPERVQADSVERAHVLGARLQERAARSNCSTTQRREQQGLA
eukprot:2620375-Alexandrium_andersonii.AAC.1